ncbi:hypothetical protein Vadar_017364 [Vaccinium darrowii]|uniref:Uncharacterized protein n=1 Tax=Vaccinium darrowii TaxID=229202 RepID=A0ACB7Y7D4_9ERIC|nr:hypothetical protein Vadar_017364 [Vaccinium darrowii]
MVNIFSMLVSDALDRDIWTPLCPEEYDTCGSPSRSMGSAFIKRLGLCPDVYASSPSHRFFRCVSGKGVTPILPTSLCDVGSARLESLAKRKLWNMRKQLDMSTFKNTDDKT